MDHLGAPRLASRAYHERQIPRRTPCGWGMRRPSHLTLK